MIITGTHYSFFFTQSSMIASLQKRSHRCLRQSSCIVVMDLRNFSPEESGSQCYKLETVCVLTTAWHYWKLDARILIIAYLYTLLPKPALRLTNTSCPVQVPREACLDSCVCNVTILLGLRTAAHSNIASFPRLGYNHVVMIILTASCVLLGK